MRIQTAWPDHQEMRLCERRDALLDSGPFSSALRSAIQVRALTLSQICRGLRELGTAVSPATLSSWQSGSRVPERPRSMAAVEQLEAMLGVPRGSLLTLLRGGRNRPARDRTGSRPRRRTAATGGPPLRADQLCRISHHDRVTIGPNRAEESVRCRQVLRAEVDGADRWIAIVEVEPNQPLPRFVPVRHCRVGRVIHRPEAGVLITELLLDHPLRKGETMITEHEIVAPSPALVSTRFERTFRTTAREFVLEIAFDPAAVPERCLCVQQPESGPVRVHEVALDATCCVTGVGLDFGPGCFGFRWTWP